MELVLKLVIISDLRSASNDSKMSLIELLILKDVFNLSIRCGCSSYGGYSAAVDSPMNLVPSPTIPKGPR